MFERARLLDSYLCWLCFHGEEQARHLRGDRYLFSAIPLHVWRRDRPVHIYQMVQHLHTLRR